jgi:hypothetical protein
MTALLLLLLAQTSAPTTAPADPPACMDAKGMSGKLVNGKETPQYSFPAVLCIYWDELKEQPGQKRPRFTISGPGKKGKPLLLESPLLTVLDSAEPGDTQVSSPMNPAGERWKLRLKELSSVGCVYDTLQQMFVCAMVVAEESPSKTKPAKK